MVERHKIGSSFITIATGTIFISGYLLYVLLNLANDVSEAAISAFTIKIFVFIALFFLITIKSRSKTLRISDPGILFFIWAVVYMLLPSGLWLINEKIPYSEYISDQLFTELQWIHLTFLSCFIISYYIAYPVKPLYLTSQSDALPSGWWLLTVSLVPLTLDVIIRIATTGNPFPSSTYGQDWYGAQDSIKQVSAQGGVAYLLLQFQSKLWFIPVLAQAIGLGLVMIRLYSSHRTWLLPLLISSFVLLSNLIFTTGSRSSAIIVIIIACIIFDMLGRPIPFRFIVISIIFGVIFFNFLGVLRIIPMSDVATYIPALWNEYTSNFWASFSEFSAMLSKEALSRIIYPNEYYYEPMNIIVNLTSIIPSQIHPFKLEWINTGGVLSKELLGDRFYDGAGVAGSMIGDGLRSGGAWGVVFVGIFGGVTTGILERFLLRTGASRERSNVIRVCLWAGFLGWFFNMFRSDLGGLLNVVFFYAIIPLYVVYSLPDNNSNKWLRSL